MEQVSDVISRIAPPCDLEPLVEALAGRQARVPRAMFPVFPTARAEIIFHFGDPFLVGGEAGAPLRPLPPAVLLGPRQRIYWQAAGPGIDWFLIQLTPLGCRRLLGLSFAEAWDDEIDLGDLCGPAAEALHERLREAGSFRARAALAVSALRMLAGPTEVDPVSRFGSLARAGRVRTLAELAYGLGVGPRRLHQKFVAAYGIGPKTFLSLMRFGRQLETLHPLSRRHGTDEPEYADESHAIREFRRFAGLTPGAYIRQKREDRLVHTGEQIPLD